MTHLQIDLRKPLCQGAFTFKDRLRCLSLCDFGCEEYQVDCPACLEIVKRVVVYANQVKEVKVNAQCPKCLNQGQHFDPARTGYCNAQE